MMQNWLLLGISAYIFYAVSTSIDKHLMNEKLEPIITNSIKMFFDFIILFTIAILFFNINISKSYFFPIFLYGLLYAVSGIFYFKALRLGDVSKIIPYHQSASIFLIFIASLLIFKENISLLNTFGIIFIVIGVCFILTEKNKKGFKVIDKSIIFISISIMLAVIFSILAKFLLFDIDPLSLAVSYYFFTWIVLFLYITFFYRKKIIENKNIFLPLNIVKIFVAGGFGGFATLLLFKGLSIGDATKVYPLAGVQSAFIFLIGVIVLKEKFKFHRFMGLFFIILGVYLISL